MTTIAIIGAHGVLDPSVIEAAVSKHLCATQIQYPIRVVTRSPQISTDKVEYVRGEFPAEPDKIAAGLAGCDVIISLQRPFIHLLRALERIVQAVRPRLYIAPLYGVEVEKVQEYAPNFGKVQKEHVYRLREHGIRVLELYIGLLAVPNSFLYEWVRCIGIDTREKTLLQRGSIKTEVLVLFVDDVARTLIVLAVSDPNTFGNIVKIELQKVLLQKMVDRYQNVHDVRLKVKAYYSAAKSLTQFEDTWCNGFDFAKAPFYFQVIMSQGPDKGLNFLTNDNELVNPKLSRWQWQTY